MKPATKKRAALFAAWYWFLSNVSAGLLVRSLFPTHVVGRENLPKDGGFIIAANHQTAIDSLVLAANLQKYVVKFYAKASYWKNPFGALLMNLTGQIPIHRLTGSKALGGIKHGVYTLQTKFGKRLGVIAAYPEGTRSRDGLLHKGRTGVARTAIDAGGAVIVPVGIIGTDRLNPPNRTLPRPGRVTIVIGKPINPYHYQELAEREFIRTHETLERILARLVTDALMKEISRLSQRELSSNYLEIHEE